MRRKCSLVLAFAMVASLVSAAPDGALAAKKIKLSKKKVTVQVNKSKTVAVKNIKKKQIKKLTVSSTKKKVATATKVGKTKIKVKGKSAGTAKIKVKVTPKKGAAKKLTLKVTVKAANDAAQSSDATQSSAATQAGASAATSAQPGASTGANASANSTAASASAAVSTQTAVNSAAPTNPGATSAVTTAPTVAPVVSTEPTPFSPVEFLKTGFEDGTTSGFAGRGGATVEVTDEGHEGKCLSVTGRTNTWAGASLNVSDSIVPGATYKVSAWVMAKGKEGDAVTIKCSGEVNGTWPTIGSVDTSYNTWAFVEGSIVIADDFTSYSIYFEVPTAATADFYVDDVTIIQTTEAIPDPTTLQFADQISLKDTYADLFPNIGVCVAYNRYADSQGKLNNKNLVECINKHYNSISLENEMKPDSILGYRASTFSVAEAKAAGYVIPDNYKDSVVPKLNLDRAFNTMEFCKENGIRMRGHTLLWHKQTPQWFFTEGYSGNTVVTPEVMDARLEFYVKTVIKLVIEKEKALGVEPGDILYTWDVVNEYLHHNDDPDSNKFSWVDVYGELGVECSYVKKAFQCAYSEVKEYNAQDKIALCYNDYNTYTEVDKLIKLIEYINAGEDAKIVNGIGMQSHLDVTFPKAPDYKAALEKFLNTGLEIQITEFDATTTANSKKKTDEDQAKYVGNIMSGIVSAHKNRDKSVNPKGVTGVTIWGFYDSVSWRAENLPLLFSTSMKKPKLSYYSFLEAVNAE